MRERASVPNDPPRKLAFPSSGPRVLSTRAGPFPRRPPGGEKGQRGQRLGGAAAAGPALAAVVVGGSVVVWLVNQDEAPYTKRRRFMIIDRGEAHT